MVLPDRRTYSVRPRPVPVRDVAERPDASDEGAVRVPDRGRDPVVDPSLGPGDLEDPLGGRLRVRAVRLDGVEGRLVIGGPGREASEKVLRGPVDHRARGQPEQLEGAGVPPDE